MKLNLKLLIKFWIISKHKWVKKKMALRLKKVLGKIKLFSNSEMSSTVNVFNPSRRNTQVKLIFVDTF